MGGAVKSVVGAITGSSAAKKQEKAMKRANQIATEQARLAEQQLNAANAKSPDIDSIKTGNMSGLGSTMLTGSAGVELDKNQKRKKTLLGE